MSTEQTPSERNARQFRIVLFAVAVVLFCLVVRPFAEANFLAAVIAGALHPLQRWLSGRLRGRRSLSAIILTAAVVVAVLTPTAIVGTVLVREAVAGARFAKDTLNSEGVMGLVGHLPAPMQGATKRVIALAPMDPEQLDEAAKERASAQQGKAAPLVQHTLSNTGAFLLQSAMLVIALFFLLIDGPKLVAWCEEASPLKRGETTEILSEFRSVSVAVIVSSLATGLVQTIAALIGYLIAGVPRPWFFALVTFFMSFIPAIGAGGTCAVAALLVLANGKVGMAIFLAVWGMLAVGLSDNLVKPLLVKRGMHMHAAVIFFALVGGLTAFGAIGLLLGPLIVSLLLTLVRLRRRQREPHIVPAT